MYWPIYHGNTLRQVSMTSGLASASLVRSATFTDSSGGAIWSCFISQDGDMMYLGFGGGDWTGPIVQYELSTAWNISTATAVNRITTGIGNCTIWVSSSGNRILVVNDSSSTVWNIDMNQWDLSTAKPKVANTLTMTDPAGVFCNDIEDMAFFIGRGGREPTTDSCIHMFNTTPVDRYFWTNFKGQTELR